MALTQICASPTFQLDARGDLRIRSPRPGDWPYEDEPANSNALSLDNGLGLWVPIQYGTVVTGPVERRAQEQTVYPGQPVEARFKQVTVSNPTVTPLRLELSLLFKTYVYLYTGVGSIEAKTWLSGETEPGWDEQATTFSGGFTWMHPFVLDASAWIEPGESVTVNAACRYRIAEKADKHIVRWMEMHPVGFTFPAYPLQGQSDHRETPPEPDYDIWIQDEGAVPGRDVSDAVAKENTRAFQSAIDKISAQGVGRVRVPDGVFEFGDAPDGDRIRMIQVKDGVEILMTPDTTVVKKGRGKFFANFDTADSSTGYDGISNWTIDGSGGIVDMNGEWVRDTINDGSQCFSFSHATNATIRNLTILHQYHNHAVDCGGNDTVLIDNVRFEGWVPRLLTKSGDFAGCAWGWQGWPYLEACQVDKPSAESGGGGAADGVPTQNMTITGCWMGPSDYYGCYPTFAGAHAAWKSTSTGPYKNIVITGNTVADYMGAAVVVMGFDGCEITDNTFTSRHDHAPYGRIDHGTKGCILVQSQANAWPNTNIVISGNRTHDTGAPGSPFSAIGVNEQWDAYDKDDNPTPIALDPAGTSGVTITNNRLGTHVGAHVISSALAPKVVIDGNRWSDPTLTGEPLVSDDMTNVTDNNGEDNDGGDPADR